MSSFLFLGASGALGLVLSSFTNGTSVLEKGQGRDSSSFRRFREGGKFCSGGTPPKVFGIKMAGADEARDTDILRA